MANCCIFGPERISNGDRAQINCKTGACAGFAGSVMRLQYICRIFADFVLKCEEQEKKLKYKFFLLKNIVSAAGGDFRSAGKKGNKYEQRDNQQAYLCYDGRTFIL